jgi:hypothetical protein
MALARYFSKDALALTQVLRTNTVQAIETTLCSHPVEVAFDENTIGYEGSRTIELLVRLLARLYPVIKITDLTGYLAEKKERLEALARSINQFIEFSDQLGSITVCVGKTRITSAGQPVIYVGSDRWLCKFSQEGPLGSGSSQLPFAAGMVAGWAADNVFRYVFRDLLKDGTLDRDFCFSLCTLACGDTNDAGCARDLGEITLAGLGAIGNGCAWALSQLKEVKGSLSLVDDQKVSLSNLQRYILCEELDETAQKVSVVARFFIDTQFLVLEHPYAWQQYQHGRTSKSAPIVLTALDSGKDRIRVQSSLPQIIFNGFTEEKMFGVSRHLDFLAHACIGCMYQPVRVKKSDSVKIAEALSIPHMEGQLRMMMHYGQNVDAFLIDEVSRANGISRSSIEQFLGRPIGEFYADFICGGILLTLTNNVDRALNIEAPLAFQSAQAGILLASELYLFRAGYRAGGFLNSTQFYSLRPLNSSFNPYHLQVEKKTSTPCLCNDDVFLQVYRQKWPPPQIS